jgi:RNA polymerase sigma-70 factor (ECF subfamily)
MSDAQTSSEVFSLEALRRQDRAEFARVVEAYSGVIYRLALKMVNNPQDAEDVLQETFLKAFRALPNFNGRSSLSTWLYRIGSNEALMLLRKRKQPMISIDEPVESEDDTQEPMDIVDWCCLPETELLSKEARAKLDQAIEQLPDSLRIVFVLRDIEGLSTNETSEVLNLSESAVKTRLSRARLRLREMLTGYYGEILRQHSDQQAAD